MARIGVTYLDIEKAALQLQGQGNLPTIDRIRHLLGTGSKTTITEHFKRWKAQQADGQGKLPQELSALVTGLWERLQAQAEQRISEIQSSHDEQIKRLQQSLEQMQKESHVLKQQLHQVVEDSIQKAEKKQAVDQLLQGLQQAHIQLESRYQTSLQQIGDLKADNARLCHMAHQIQTNLEHYQQAMQLLRAEQSLETEKREASFQVTIQELKHALLITQQEAAARLQMGLQKLWQRYSLDGGWHIIGLLIVLMAILTITWCGTPRASLAGQKRYPETMTTVFFTIMVSLTMLLIAAWDSAVLPSDHSRTLLAPLALSLIWASESVLRRAQRRTSTKLITYAYLTVLWSIVSLDFVLNGKTFLNP